MGILDQVTAKPSIKPPRIVIHGKGGSGKTSFGADIPGVLFVPAEDGLGKLSVPHTPQPERFDDLMQTLGELQATQHEYRALCLDTIDHIEPLVWEKVCEVRSAAGKQNYGHIEEFGYGKGYLFSDPYWAKLFFALDGLRRKGMLVCVLAHNETKPVNDPIVGPYDSVHPKLHKRANALLYEWADIVGYLDIEKAQVEKEGARGRKLTTAQSTGGGRVLYLEDIGGFEAKNRYDLPARISIPKEHPYHALRSEIRKALGIDEKEAA